MVLDKGSCLEFSFKNEKFPKTISDLLIGILLTPSLIDSIKESLTSANVKIHEFGPFFTSATSLAYFLVFLL